MSSLTAAGPMGNGRSRASGVPIWEDVLRRGIWPRPLVVWMTSLYLALFIIRPWERLFPELGPLHIERVYAICMIVACVCSARLVVRLDLQTLTVILLVGAIGLSAAAGVAPGRSWHRFYKYLTLVIFYFVLVWAIRTPYELIFVIVCYIVAMGLYLAKAEWEYFVHGAGKYEMGMRRLIGIDGTFEGPNDVGASVVFSLPILYFLYLVRYDLTRGWPAFWRKAFPWALGVYTALCASAVFLTRSRSGVLGLMLFLLLVVLRGHGLAAKAKRLALAAAFCAIAWVVITPDIRNRIRTMWDSSAGPASAKTSAEGRWYGFLAGVAMFNRYPFTGVGIGNFVPYRVRNVDGVPLEAHNLEGQLLGETGIIGVMAFLAFLGAIVLDCRRIQRIAAACGDRTAEILALLAVAFQEVLILLLFKGLFGHNLLRFNWLWIAAFGVVALAAARRLARRRGICPFDLGGQPAGG